VKKILFVHNHRTQFVRLDLAQLEKLYQVTEYCLDSRWLNPVSIWNQVKRHDLVFGWFASWHTFLPMQFARRLHKPSLLVIGGYDLASIPEIDYGHQRGGMKRWLSRHTMRSATCLVTNSEFSQSEAVRNASLKRDQVHAIYHGVPDPFKELPPRPRERMVLTVGNIDRSTLHRKGHEAFVRTAALMPDVSFVLAGAARDETFDRLRSIATANVNLTGRLSDEALNDYYGRASVYVQASRHEGFGMSVAEAMLAGCVPVVTRAGSLPEVTGEMGIFAESAEPADLAQAITNALTCPDATRAAIRQRILDRFPMEKRGQLLHELIRPLMNGSD
jgi:glycosyltransferase involved in cell wall biosynthesis